MVEKRKYRREKVNMRVCYGEGAYTKVRASVVDISEGGMFVHDTYAPEVQENLEASLDAEDFGKVVWVEGLVVRKTNTGFGVMFTNTDKRGLENLLVSTSTT